MSVFNGEKYLRDSIDSLLNQTCKDFDLLIINDGSTDRTSDILNDYINVSTPNVSIINFKQNIGLSHHLSRVLNYTQSDLIIRMDADDISYPTRIEKIISAYRRYNFDWYNSFVEHIDLDGNIIGLVPESDIKIEQKRKYLYYMNFFCHGSAAFSRKALMDVGGYDSSIKYAQDYDLWLKFLGKKKKLFFDKNVLYQQRITNESISHVKIADQIYFTLKISSEHPGLNKLFNIFIKFCYKHYNYFTRIMYSYFVIIFKKVLLISKTGK